MRGVPGEPSCYPYAEKGRATLASTFYGVSVLHLLGRSDLPDKKSTVAFVLAHKGRDDGFGMMRGGVSSPQATAMALRTLSALDAVSSDIREGAVRYLESAIEFLGTQGTRYRAIATMQSAADIVEGLTALKALREVDTSKVASFAESLYVPQNGGFGPSSGLGTTPPTTYQGVLILHTLGRLAPLGKK